jgi:hypothetical protein
MKKATKPTGSIPAHIQGWLEVNGEECWPLLVCDTCGGWVSYIDHLAPYHTEANTCERCDATTPDKPSPTPTAPPSPGCTAARSSGERIWTAGRGTTRTPRIASA